MNTTIIEAKEDSPYNYGEARYAKYRKMRMRDGKVVSHADFMEHMRDLGRGRREVHSDGFLAVSKMARGCSCGGCAVYSDGYVCPRCYEYVNE